MELEKQEIKGIVEAYREQFGRVHHLDRLVLVTFAVLTTLILALCIFFTLGITQDELILLGIVLMATSLAAGGAHTTIANASDYLVTFVVVGQMTKGLGLVRRGLFPSSLLAQPPQGFFAFARHLVGGFRGSFLIIYLTLGWYSAFLAVSQWLEHPLAFGLAALPPFVLGGLSVAFCYNRARHQLTALRRHEELSVASEEDLVDRHCDFAEALLWLDPPRLLHAQRQYELALEIEPDSPRAKEGLQRVLTWKSKERP